ncbi:sensor histidine kinase [Mesorhizobium waimense]|uniref:sensor histidine kinase n=1 Tax=Mesorhizobium waimense TaxID=1300307 RepID=UPI001FE135FD|nr:sensor histidine kinase [Mesorhizobium waimense]
MLAVVQAIASQTMRNAKSLPEAGRTLASRLVSLAKAHEILTQENWSGADLRDLVTASITPHAGIDRFQISGEAVWLPPNLALSLALAIHELTTNAIKYGALSAAGGTVSICWTVNSRSERQRLSMQWRELGGPPVRPAEQKGFGTRMLERIFDSESTGSVSMTFEPPGVVCTFEMKLGMPGETELVS